MPKECRTGDSYARRGDLTRKSFRLTAAQCDFLKRKKEELARYSPPGESISEETIVRGLLDFWMTFEREGIPHKDDAPEGVTIGSEP